MTPNKSNRCGLLASNAMSLVALIGLLSTNLVVAADPADSSIIVTITADAIELAVPMSSVSLRLPKGNLAPVEDSRTGATASRRYFHFEDAGRGLVVSGWFESAKSFKGFESFWVGEFSAMKQTGLIPTAPPTSVAVGNWSGAAYEIAMPSGAGKDVNTHIRAELIKAGTWVDLHISITSRKPLADARSEALEFLKSIVVY
ncbi:MAG TPA: hypothetical protein VGO61_05115 [Steroidobacteraceae bacterium]|jgi:hypothetical protein|nr:hypothetical protein [Steroidobacteraceae bacterium]